MNNHVLCVAATMFVCSLAANNTIRAQTHSAATSAAERQTAWRQHVELKRTSPFKHLKWRALGPTRQGGRIEAIACPPGYDTTIYLGVGSGNLWKTTNNATTWTPIFEKESTLTIGDMAVHPRDHELVIGTHCRSVFILTWRTS